MVAWSDAVQVKASCADRPTASANAGVRCGLPGTRWADDGLGSDPEYQVTAGDLRRSPCNKFRGMESLTVGG